MRNEIVVGLDDSPSGEAASAWAAQHAGSTGSAVSADHREYRSTQTAGEFLPSGRRAAQ